jgi:hypothetical protein
MRHWFGEQPTQTQKQTQTLVYWQYGMYLWLLMMHGGAMYFLLAKAAQRGYVWQIAFFQATLWEVILDAGLVTSLEIYLLYYLIPVLGLSEMRRILHSTLPNAIDKICYGDNNHNKLSDSGLLNVSNNNVFVESLLPEQRLIQSLSAYLTPVGNSSDIEQEPITTTATQQQQSEINTSIVEVLVQLCRKCTLYIVYWTPAMIVDTLVNLMSAFSVTLMVFMVLFVVQPLLRPYFAPHNNNNSNSNEVEKEGVQQQQDKEEQEDSIGLVTVSWLIVGCPIVVLVCYIVVQVVCRVLSRRHSKVVREVEFERDVDNDVDDNNDNNDNDGVVNDNDLEDNGNNVDDGDDSLEENSSQLLLSLSLSSNSRSIVWFSDDSDISDDDNNDDANWSDIINDDISVSYYDDYTNNNNNNKICNHIL